MGGPLPQRAQARTRHYQASVGEVRTGLSGEQSILARMSFEVIFLLLLHPRVKIQDGSAHTESESDGGETGQWRDPTQAPSISGKQPALGAVGHQKIEWGHPRDKTEKAAPWETSDPSSQGLIQHYPAKRY